MMPFSTLTVGLIISILLIVFFAGLEMAFISSNRLNIELKKKQGTLGGNIIGRFLDRPYEFIGTNVVGLTLSLVVYSLLVSRFMDPFIEWLMSKTDWKNPSFALVFSLLIDVVLATAIILILAELLPKAIFKRKANSVLYLLAVPSKFFYWLLYPATKMLIEVSQFMLKYLFNVRIRSEKEPFQRIDLEHFVNHSLQGANGSDDTLHQALFENALQLLKLKARSCMVPRNEIVALSAEANMVEVEETFKKTQLSRIPVFEKNIDHIIGYIHHLDLLKKPTNLRSALHSIPMVPESMNVPALMEQLNKEKKSIAWVIDEYGGTAGILTMEDVLEEVFGEIEDEYDNKILLEQQLAFNTFIFSGRQELAYLNEHYHLDFPQESTAETLSGYIIHNLGRIPKRNEKLVIKNIEFDILLVTDTRIETVKLKTLR